MSKKSAEDLRMLFDFVPPAQLKATIVSLLLENLLLTPKDQPHKKEVYRDIYILLEFLDKQK